MAGTILLEAKLIVPEVANPTPDQVQKFVNGLQVNAEIIRDRAITSIPDGATYGSKLAEPSSEGYENYTAGISALTKKGRPYAEVLERQRVRASKAYSKWVRGVTSCHDEINGTSRFKKAVENKKLNWAEGVTDSTLRFTGSRANGRGAAAIAGYLLTADPRVLGMLRAGDEILQGEPVDVSLTGQANAYRAAITNTLLRAGQYLLYSDAAGKWANAIVWTTNGANAFLDIAKADKFDSTLPDPTGVSRCEYIDEFGVLKLYIRLYKT
jgi:hypothetical protein